MQLWTYHPSDFRINDPNLEVDYKKGKYSHPDIQVANGFRYCKVIPKLHEMVGTTQFLWCFTQQDQFARTYEDDDSLEWELNVPLTQILTFYREKVWEGIIISQNDDWDRLLIAVGETEPAGSELNDLGALVRVPLEPNQAKNHGQPPVRNVGAGSRS